MNPNTKAGAPADGGERKSAAAAADAFAHLTIELDRSRNHSEVHGEPEHNLGFIQDGLPFDKGGRLIKPLLKRPEYEKAAVVAERKIARMKAAIEEAERAEITDTANTESPSAHKVEEDPDADVNLKLWAEGKVKYLPHIVYRVMRKRYGKHFHNFSEVTAWLVKERVVDERNVAV